MSCCGAIDRSGEDIKAANKTKLIDQELKAQRRSNEAKIKLLLLGTGDSGKSTFVKQMKVIHKDGFSTAETAKFQRVLQDNCLTSMQRILQHEVVKIPPEKEDLKAKVFASEDLIECYKEIIELWENETVKDAFDRRGELGIQVPPTADYYFVNAERFSSESFVPTAEDMFRAKLKTTGISEIAFILNDVEFTIVDVGGQRSERRKWLHCFDDVTCVIFLAALDEYDMKLEEDNTTNRFEESLRLYSEVTSSNFFQPTSWILFLNKCDVFQQKIKKKPLTVVFNDISKQEAGNYDDSCKFIQRRYEAYFKGSRMYAHVTCAIDTTNCKRVFIAVRDTIIHGALNEAGF